MRPRRPPSTNTPVATLLVAPPPADPTSAGTGDAPSLGLIDGTVDDKSGEGTTDAGAGDAVAVPVGLAEGSGAADGGGVGGAVGVGARLGRGVGGRVGTGVGGLVDVEMTVTTPDICSGWISQK